MLHFVSSVPLRDTVSLSASEHSPCLKSQIRKAFYFVSKRMPSCRRLSSSFGCFVHSRSSKSRRMRMLSLPRLQDSATYALKGVSGLPTHHAIFDRLCLGTVVGERVMASCCLQIDIRFRSWWSPRTTLSAVPGSSPGNPVALVWVQHRHEHVERRKLQPAHTVSSFAPRRSSLSWCTMSTIALRWPCSGPWRR